MDTKKIKRLKLACYTTCISQSIVANLSPLLFLIFHNMYDISFAKLGLLVVINFATQLSIDLIFSVFSYKFNIPLAVKTTPALTALGLMIYALSPFVLPKQFVFWGIALGTLVFSAAGGFAEVLISPVIAAIPSKDPDREMSKLHSTYAWGVVFVVIFSTLFLHIFGGEAWQYLTLVLTSIPLSSCLLFSKVQIPPMETPKRISGVLEQFKDTRLWICVVAIFFGGATELTMAQWSSGYLEKVFGIDKVLGDVFGVALFGAMLGLGRTLYTKFGKNMTKVLIFEIIGAFACYVTVAVTNNAIIGLLSCVLTGLCVSMLWPGCLIVAGEYFKNPSVLVFAMLAAGGDLGASIGPQLVGLITDMSKFGEEIGMKIGLAVSALFPLLAIPVYIYMHKDKRRK